LVDRDPAVRAALGPLVEPLERAEALARLLMARRRQRGAIDFDLPEAEVVLDLRGRPEQIVRAERSIAHQMIEEFMLAANEAVARELGRRKLGFSTACTSRRPRRASASWRASSRASGSACGSRQGGRTRRRSPPCSSR